MTRGDIIMAGLMPHAPVLIPEVAGERLKEVETSVDSMRRLSRMVLQLDPTRLVLISPHAPRRPGMFGVWTDPSLKGSLRRFGFPRIMMELPNDLLWTTAARDLAVEHGIHLWVIDDEPLDHGALVPLRFLEEAGWAGPTVVVSLNEPGEGGMLDLGDCIRHASGHVGGTTVVIASGDMSHRLKAGAPAGFHRDAARFDEAFVEIVRTGDYRGLESLDLELIQSVGEDVMDSTVAAVASVGFRNQGHEVLSYEGPFGVGYCVAILHQGEGSEGTKDAHERSKD